MPSSQNPNRTAALRDEAEAMPCFEVRALPPSSIRSNAPITTSPCDCLSSKPPPPLPRGGRDLSIPHRNLPHAPSTSHSAALTYHCFSTAQVTPTSPKVPDNNRRRAAVGLHTPSEEDSTVTSTTASSACKQLGKQRGRGSRMSPASAPHDT